jgi:hypothetical protein
MDLPAFVICRDVLEPLIPTVQALEDAGVTEIYLIDNNSTWPPLLEWYEQTPHTVVRWDVNRGKKGPWRRGVINRKAGDRPFIVTDPDIVPYEDCPSDWIGRWFQILDEFPDIVKVGFGLPTNDLPDQYEFKDEAIRRQAQHFHPARRIPGVGYRTPLDTTMALYRPHTPYCTGPAIRTEAPYVARHLGWYIDSANPSPELIHYRKRAHRQYGNWTKKQLPGRIANNPDKIVGVIKPKRQRT